MTMQDQDLIQDCVARAKKRVEIMHQKIQDLSEANSGLIEGSALGLLQDSARKLKKANKPGLTNNGSYPGSGNATVAMGFIYGSVTCDLSLDSGDKLHFYGTQWGFGFGGGIVWGGGWFYLPPDAILGNATYVLTNLPSELTLDWYHGPQLIGSFVGGGLAVSFAGAGGNGDWSKA